MRPLTNPQLHVAADRAQFNLQPVDEPLHETAAARHDNVAV